MVLKLFSKRSLSSVPKTSTTINRKELLYRSKQRGWLEVDLILGSWASDNIMNLSESQLADFQKILNVGTFEIYTFLIDVKPTPEYLKNEIFYKIQKYAKEDLKMRNTLEYEGIKKKMSN